MAQTVAATLVGVLERIGVKQIFALIGNSLNPLADAVRHSSIEWIGVRHEEGAALAASGQAKLTGRLAVCAGTTGPGSTHLVAGLYEAARDHAPVLATLRRHAAQNARRRLLPNHQSRSAVSRCVALHGNHHVAGAGSRRHPSGDRCGLCRPRRCSSHTAARRHLGTDRRRRRQRGYPATAPRVRGERGGCRPYREPDRRGRQCSHHVRRRLPWSRSGAAGAIRPSQGAADPFCQGPGHHALR